MAQSEDPHVADVLNSSLPSDDEDALIASLEEDDSISFSAFREQRIQQLHHEFSRAKSQRSAGFGTYNEIKDEKELMELTTSTKYVVVHFFKPDFARCGIMDTHLEILSRKQYDTRFLKINVENAPFLVSKLTIRILPCVICWVNGRSVDRLVGFEGLGHTQDVFTTRDLESRFLNSGVIQTAVIGNTELSTKQKVREEKKNNDEEDSDWD